jgi:hypothetical protein
MGEQDLTPFTPHARAAVNAEAMFKHCRAEEPEILLDMAYRKRIRPVPPQVLEASTQRYLELAEAAQVRFEDTHDAELSISELRALVWARLDEAGRYEWLRKVG